MALLNAADSGLFDCLPSIRRPTAWEMAGDRNRQVANARLLDRESSHSADESFARVSSAPVYRTAYSSASLPGSATRRPIIEV